MAKEVGRDWIPQSLTGHGKKVAFYPKNTGEPRKVFSGEETRQDLKCHPGCCVEISWRPRTKRKAQN